MSSDPIHENSFLSRGCSCTTRIDAESRCLTQAACAKLHASNWFDGIAPPERFPTLDIVEVRFKNSRKDYYRAAPGMNLQTGDIVAVESSPGHDIGIVSLCGEIIRLQLKKKKINPKTGDFRKVYRKAKPSDIEKWAMAIKQEQETMLRSRGMSSSLKLSMKISDVEYQGDRTKATFYYTADDRVDFRELIKVLAEAFHVRIEMRQIGMRQEASRIGGIGSCGRELCCTTWLTQFRSVSTNAARTQQLSLNPQKLAGQCSKLKCCINYENDIYQDAMKEFPPIPVDLATKKGKASCQKIDVLKKTMGYAYFDNPSHIVMLPVSRVKEIMVMNNKKQLPEELLPQESYTENNNRFNVPHHDLEESLTRFDNPTKQKKRRRRKGGGKETRNNNNND